VLALLIGVSVGAALLAARFSGLEGPWLWNADLPKIHYPLASFFHGALTEGRLPLWEDRLGLGFPLYAEGQIGAFYPPSWLFFQFPPLVALDLIRISHLVLAGTGAGLIGLRLTGVPAAGVVAAGVAVLSGAVVTKLEWTNFVIAYGWAPWVLLPLLRRPAPTRRGLVVAGLLWGVQALAGFPNIWLLTGLTAATAMLAIAPRPATIARLAGFGLIGAAVGAVQLIPTALLTLFSVRSKGLSSDDLFTSAATPFDLLGVLFANPFIRLAGGDWDYFSNWYPDGWFALLEAAAYLAIPVVGLALIGARSPRARPFLAIVAVMVAIPVVAIARPAIWQELPFLNALRSPTRAYVFASLALAILAGIGVARASRQPERAGRVLLAVLAAAASLYGLAIVLALGLPATFEGVLRDSSSGLGAERAVELRELASEALLAALPLVVELVLATLVVILAVRLLDRRAVGGRIVLALLALLPLALFSPPANPLESSGAFSFAERPFVQALQAARPHRLLTLGRPGWYPGMPDQLASAGVADIEMFSSLDLLSKEELLVRLRQDDPAAAELRRAAGIDLVVTFDGRPCDGTLVGRVEEEHADLCRPSGSLRPPYWIPREAVPSLGSGGGWLVPPGEAQLDIPRILQDARSVEVRRWGPADADLSIDAPSDGWVWIDRAWWPAWQVRVDGRDVEVHRAMGGQLVAVAGGRHEISQRLVPVEAIAGLVLGLVAAGIALAWAWLPHGRFVLGERRLRLRQRRT
jgi:hypothetical protein